MQLKEFLCRASAGGKLATNPRSKSETLSETTKSYVKDWIKEQIYGYRNEIKSKYLDKGLQLEDKAIDRTIQALDIPFGIKNEKYFEDEYFCGTPDLIVDGVVYDTKCSWDCFTFPLFETEIPTKDYFYQLQIYMHLTGCKKAKLVYVLLNTPESLTYEQPKDYSGLANKYTVKSFDVEYDEAVINDLKERVKEVREFIKTINI